MWVPGGVSSKLNLPGPLSDARCGVVPGWRTGVGVTKSKTNVLTAYNPVEQSKTLV